MQKLILLKRGRDVSWAVIKLIAVFTAKFPAVLSAPLHYRAHQQEKHMILALYRYHQRLHLLKEGHHWWIHSLHVTNDKTDKTSVIIMSGEDENRKDLFSPGKHLFAWTSSMAVCNVYTYYEAYKKFLFESILSTQLLNHYCQILNIGSCCCLVKNWSWMKYVNPRRQFIRLCFFALCQLRYYNNYISVIVVLW